MKRICIFIDGENMKFSLKKLYEPEEGVNSVERQFPAHKAHWQQWFDALCTDAAEGSHSVRVRTYWYHIDGVQYYPPTKLLKKDSGSIRRWVEFNKHDLSSTDRQTAEEWMEQWNETNKSDEEIKNYAKEKLAELNAQRQWFDNIHTGIRYRQQQIAAHNRAVQFCRSGEIRYNLITKKLGEEKTVDVNMAVDMVAKADNFDTAIVISGDQDCVPAVVHLKDCGKEVINVSFEKNGKLLPGGAKLLNETTDWTISVSAHDLDKVLKLKKASKEEEEKRPVKKTKTL